MALPYLHSTIKLHLKMALPCTRCTLKLHCSYSAMALRLHCTRKTTSARLHSLHCNYAQCTRYNGRATQGYDFWWLLTRDKARSLTLHLRFNAREPRYNWRAHNKIVLFANSIFVARRLMLSCSSVLFCSSFISFRKIRIPCTAPFPFASVPYP